MTRWRLFLFGGNLNNGANAGLWYANLNNAPANANWNYAARISDIQRHVSCLEGTRKRLAQMREMDEPAPETRKGGRHLRRKWTQVEASSNPESL